MRYLTMLAVSAAAILALAACGSSSPSTIPPLAPEGQSGPTATSPPTQGDAVTGTVTWPDGHPAGGASVYFNNHETGFSGSGWSQHDSANSWYQLQQLPADGSYSLPGCPCGYLTAYLLVPSAVMSPANGGWDCWIIMQDDNGSYSGLQANPGDVIDWKALDMPCSPTWYTSDQSTVQSERTVLDPSLNGGDYSAYAGTWQAAELRASGGGSGG